MRGEADIARLLEAGNVHRAVAAHNLNEHSSRSCARRAPACHGARLALLLRLGPAKGGGLAGIIWQLWSPRICGCYHKHVMNFMRLSAA